MKYTNKETGLTTAQAEESRRTHGSNILTPPQRDPWWKLLLEKFTDPLIIILLVAVVISFIPVLLVPGHSMLESLGILGAVLLATTVSFVNEYRANKEFDILNKVNDVTPMRVLRDGAPVMIPKSDIVVGDIVMLETGIDIPADGVVLEAVSFRVNQSSLTGESEPVLKHPTEQTGAGASDALPGAYADDVVLRSTLVTEGHAVICVTKVGDATEIGKVATAATAETETKSPLNLQLDGLCKAISVAGSTIALLLFAALIIHDTLRGQLLLSSGQWVFFGAALLSLAVALFNMWYPILQDLLGYMKLQLPSPGILRQGGTGWLKCLAAGALVFLLLLTLIVQLGCVTWQPATWLTAQAANDILTYFMIAITLIVVSVPEGLPMSVTLSLAYSMRKMARQNCLVRRMDACETIGAATVICSDKTGTLTMNRMSVREPLFPGIAEHQAQAPIFPLLAEAVAVNSTADLSPSGDVLGNVTEGAMLLYLRDCGCDYAALRHRARLIAQLPFSTHNKFMATCVASPLKDGSPVIYIKGAPEIVLERCSSSYDGEWNHAKRESIRSTIAQAQRKAMRVLGLACGTVQEGGLPENPDELKDACRGLTWLGCFVIQDPVRPDVPEAVATCLHAGVGVKIVTGDNKETACQIGREIGLLPEGQLPHHAVMTGEEFGKLSDEELSACVNDLRVLSRAKPMDKMRLVNTLQQKHHVVAVTGDGTNDAPALNHADVGLSMGITGTSVAKEASDIILLDDSFTSITRAVKWGRSLYRNIQKFIVFQLTVNVAACGVVALGPFTGCELPLTVTQMLWVNLIMDTFAALALATEPPSDDVMDQQPRNKLAFIITPSMWKWILGLGIAFILAAEVYIGTLAQGGRELDTRDVTMLFTGFVMLQFWNLFNARVYGTSKSFLSGLGSNPSFLLIALIILVGQFLAVTFGGEVFRTVPLSLAEWVTIALVTLPVLVVGEVVRAIARAREAAGRR